MNKIVILEDEEVLGGLRLLRESETLYVDTETSGLDPYTCKLWSVQIGTDNDVIFFPWATMGSEARDHLRKVFAGKTLVAHNAKFDIKFLAVNGFEIHKAYCTREVEACLNAGRYFTVDLASILLRRFQIQLDKSVRSLFYTTDGTKPPIEQWLDEEGAAVWTNHPEIVEYALEDIVYLPELVQAQEEEIRDLGLQNVVWIENNLVPEVARMELRGVNLDVKETKKFQSKVLIAREKLEKEVNDLLGRSWNLHWQEEFTKRMKLLDAWKELHEVEKQKAADLRKGIKANKAEEEQIREKAKKIVAASVAKKPYNKLPSLDEPFSLTSPIKLRASLSKACGIDIPTTKADWLEENISLHPAIELLLEFRKFEKLAQFCELQNVVNPVTKRIHASFNQSGTKSGRFSSNSPNLQQIPVRSKEAKEFRGLFRPKKGYSYVGADLAGIELVIMASLSGETDLLSAIEENKDVHCFTMSKVLSHKYEDLKKLKDGEELTSAEANGFNRSRSAFQIEFRMPELLKLNEQAEWVGKFRDYVKTMTYGIAYGQTAYGASNKFHCPYEVADRLINEKFFGAYPHLKQWIRSTETTSYERGYSKNNLGRRRWFTKPKKKSYEQVEKEVLARLKSENRVWESVSDAEWGVLITKALEDAEKEHRSRVNSIKRQGANFIPQSMCADMVKLAMILFGRYLSNYSEGIVLTIHDELIVECETSKAEEVASKLEETMRFAVNKFLPSVTVKVDAKIMDRWEK